MKKTFYSLCSVLSAALLLSACGVAAGVGTAASDDPAAKPEIMSAAADTGIDLFQPSLPESVFTSYYAAQSDPAFSYIQHKSIQRFLAMWVKEATGDIEKPQWDPESFARINILDHDLVESRPEEQLFCWTFSDGAGRYGYAILKFNAEDPSVSNWSIAETTPYVYDLRANQSEISEALAKTDVDLSTATASRVYLFDRENNRADQVIRFTDGKGDNYLCFLGSNPLEIQKW